MGITLVPSTDLTVASAPSTRRGGAESAAGEALHTFPVTVPRFLIWGLPIRDTASWRAWAFSLMTEESAIWLRVAAAPIRMNPPSSRT